ncbi:MAG: preprotein translocase subunit SecG [Magnetovibrionaceae bacterium]
MTTVLLVIHILLALGLVGVVLLQKSEGGALGMGGGSGGGGMGGFMTGRATANLLTRATAGLATAFFVTSLALALLHDSARDSGSILDAPGGQLAPMSAPSTPAEPAAPAAPIAE